MKFFLIFRYIIFINIFFIACNNEEDDNFLYTLIPDENFEKGLISRGIDSEGVLDGKILTFDAEKVERLFIQGDRYGFIKADYITGIEAFINLKVLEISGSKEKIIDLSNNNKLETLYLYF